MALDAPDVHAPHRRHGVHWAEILLSVSALIVSFASIGIAVHHGKIMEKLVAANSMPFLLIDNSNLAEMPDGSYERRLTLSLRNPGVGPAQIRYFRISYSGHPVRNVAELIDRCCADPAEARRVRAELGQVISGAPWLIPAREKGQVYAIRATPQNRWAWDKIEAMRSKFDYEVCYCSVFDECWVRHNDDDRKHVRHCTLDAQRDYQQ